MFANHTISVEMKQNSIVTYHVTYLGGREGRLTGMDNTKKSATDMNTNNKKSTEFADELNMNNTNKSNSASNNNSNKSSK